MNRWQEKCRVKIITADFEGLCRLLFEEGIPISDIKTNGDLSYTFLCSCSDRKKLERLCQSRGDDLKIKSSSQRYKLTIRSRPILWLGIFVLLFLFLYLPTRILFIQVTGNERVPMEKILEAANDSGVSFGTSRKNLRSEQIKNDLLLKIPELRWVGVNTRGCVAQIAVKEQESSPKYRVNTGLSSVVASMDGVIVSCKAAKGMLLCRPGQAVLKDQVLISAYEDLGNHLKATGAQGEIFADTKRNLHVIADERIEKRGDILKTHCSVSLIAGKKRIKLFGTSGNWAPGCGRIYKEYYMSLPGGYRLPFQVTIDIIREHEFYSAAREDPSLEDRLSAFSDCYLESQMVAGQILKKEEQFERQNGLRSLWIKYHCREMIGFNRQEKIGENLDRWKES